ncbi:MAG TPA: hypothetical protein VFX59_06660 [Polyangiales bacterium]|nr:hypothetical protein [Polyangiales bacterium]
MRTLLLRTWFTITLLMLSLAAAVPWRAPARAAGKPLLVVVAAASPIKDIEFALLRRAFEGAAAEIGGKRLIPINHPAGSPLRVAFDKQVLGLAPEDVGKFWIERRIRDEGSPPKTVPSPELAVRIAGSLPFSITYSTQELINATVKAITIGGKAAGSAGYPLNL